MQIEYENKQAFETTSIYLASYLVTKGISLLTVEKQPYSNRYVFVLEDSEERCLLTEAYQSAKENDPRIQVDARKHDYATRLVKERLYEFKRDDKRGIA